MNLTQPPPQAQPLRRRRTGRGRRRHARRLLAKAVLAATLLGVFIVAAAIGMGSPFSEHQFSADTHDLALVAEEQLHQATARPVYPYSVIPGGVYTPGELREAAERDTVVAAAYSSLAADSMRPRVVTADRLVFMSYRRDDKIYWTKHRIRLREGETILTNGVEEIRARCGNGISMDPLEPTAESDPAELDLEPLAVDGRMPLIGRPIGFGNSPRGSAPGSWLDSTAVFGPGALFGGAPLFTSTFPAPPGSVPPGLDEIVDSVLNPSPRPPSGGGGPTFVPPPDGPSSPPVIRIPGGLTPPTDSEDDPIPDEPGFPTGNPPVTPVPTPEPGTILLVLSGGGLLLRRLRSKNAASSRDDAAL